MMARPFAKTFACKFASRPSRAGSGATINGRPAWQVVAERKAANQESSR